MAITDINISDTLETGAPSITYEGNEGPQDPRQEQQMMMAQLEEEYKKYVFEMQEQGLEPMSFQQFIEQVMAEGQMSSAQPMPNRQMAAYGGIMDLGGRRRYGIGSSLKKRIRKLIPNEVADVAVKAAPFVAPFNPIAGGLMAGLGGFDQHGSLSRGVKSGLMTYGMGQLGRKVGGAEVQTGWQNPFSKASWSSPYVQGKDIFSKTKEKFFPGKDNVLEDTVVEKVFEQQVSPNHPSEAYKPNLNKAIKQGTSGIMDFINKNSTAILLGSMGIAAATAKPQDVQEAMRVSRGTGLDIDSIRAEVQEALAGGKETWNKLKEKYPYIGEYETKIGAAEGGIMRPGFYTGGLSIPSENTMEDARKTAMQDKLGGITEIMKQADLYRQGDVGQMYMAGGGDTTPWWKFWADEKAAAEELTPQQKNKIKKQKRLEELKKELDMAQGGRIGAQEGGLMDLGGMEKDYREEGGFVPIGGKEKADDVPARLSKNEFVFTADAVRGAGDGDIDKGAERMESMMKKLESKGKKENMKMAGGGERGWKAQMLADEWAWDRYGKEFYDLSHVIQMQLYNEALDFIDSGAKRNQGAEEMFEVSERLSEVV